METRAQSGGSIIAVEPGSVAERAGIKPGWRLTAINGHPIRDLIDYRFYASDARLALDLQDGETVQRVQVRLPEDEALGLEFGAPTFDNITTCVNKCPFCFLKGLPRGLRRSLYVKDDDYRYSFLFGNFITLSNLSEADWARLEEQRLSPLYVSVHATDPDVRAVLIGKKNAPAILEQLDRLAKLGIRVHTQIVVCPGLNDRAELEQTIDQLAARYPTVQSIAVVPVGLTHRNLGDAVEGLRLLTDAEMDAILRQVHAFQRRNLAQLDTHLVHAADEYYLRLGRPLPGAARYDGYPQYQNGVGMTRSLLDEWRGIRRRLQRVDTTRPENDPAYTGSQPRRLTLVCGTLIAPTLARITDEWNEMAAGSYRLALAPVENRFFGTSVTVSGLLTGTDLIAEFGPEGRRAGGDALILPHWMFDLPGERTLDGMTPAEIEAGVGRPVRVVDSLAALLRALQHTSPKRPSPVSVLYNVG